MVKSKNGMLYCVKHRSYFFSRIYAESIVKRKKPVYPKMCPICKSYQWKGD